MNIKDMRKAVLLWSIAYGHEEITDRLLDARIKVPDVADNFYITINGVPACRADLALLGQFTGSVCQHTSLRRCIELRHGYKAMFSGAIVAVVAGSCPTALSFLRAA
ncbi:MAG TPA: hypothetical protein VLH08_05515 [Acidobacteriota bacterium]|nr:hypothetical protein [Acidobacteriota bacterium]